LKSEKSRRWNPGPETCVLAAAQRGIIRLSHLSDHARIGKCGGVIEVFDTLACVKARSSIKRVASHVRRRSVRATNGLRRAAVQREYPVEAPATQQALGQFAPTAHVRAAAAERQVIGAAGHEGVPDVERRQTPVALDAEPGQIRGAEPTCAAAA